MIGRAMRLLFSALLVACLVSPATARDPIYLTLGQVDFSRILPPPPRDDSSEAAMELAELHALASDSTPDRMAQAAYDDRNETMAIYKDVLGADLSAFPKLDALFDDIQNDRRAATDRAKDFFKRRRPVVRDPSIKTCGTYRDPLSSYPSGHAAWGFASGTILAAMVPGKATEILARSRDFAQSRLVCGMHFRSDVVAGQVLGTVVAERLMNNPDFRARMAEAAAELKSALENAGKP